MELFHFATTHGLDILGTLAITASLLFTAVELRHVEKAQRVSNLLTITAHHRKIWSLLFSTPSLSRVLNADVHLAGQPVTSEERIFVTFLIFHLNNSFQAESSKMFRPAAGLAADIAGFFALPIPKAVWMEVHQFQDSDFVRFVETARGKRDS
jgi:hypothetical protein